MARTRQYFYVATDAARRFTLVTLGVDLGDRWLETIGAIEGTTGTAMLGGGGG
jgi:hypothetical protein